MRSPGTHSESAALQDSCSLLLRRAMTRVLRTEHQFAETDFDVRLQECARQEVLCHAEGDSGITARVQEVLPSVYTDKQQSSHDQPL
jgi:hypothetical protein